MTELDTLIAQAQQMKRFLEGGLRCNCLRLEDYVINWEAGCHQTLTFLRAAPTGKSYLSNVLSTGQPNGKGRALLHLAGNGNRAAMCLHDPLDNRQP